MKKYAAITALTVAVIGWLWFRMAPERYEIPAGYMGPVVVFFGHPDGVRAARDWRTIVYRVPANGILLIKDTMASGFTATEWVYRAADGELTPLQRVGPTTGTQVGLSDVQTHSKGHAEWVQAAVGRSSDPDSFGTNPHFIVSEIIDRLAAKRSP